MLTIEIGPHEELEECGFQTKYHSRGLHCPWCHDTGQMRRCKTCKAIDCDGDHDDWCPSCDNQGLVTCPACKGEGHHGKDEERTDCETCKGKGEITCTTC
jgi:hypothetical protein